MLESLSSVSQLAPEPITNEQKLMLISSKLVPPRLPLSLVERSRLLDKLDEIMTYPLTLVSASAGSGKTTLLSAWAMAFSSRQRGTEWTVAWLSLDATDNDPLRFWGSVIAALNASRGEGQPQIGSTALSLLQSQETFPRLTILTLELTDFDGGPKQRNPAQNTAFCPYLMRTRDKG